MMSAADSSVRSYSRSMVMGSSRTGRGLFEYGMLRTIKTASSKNIFCSKFALARHLRHTAQ